MDLHIDEKPNGAECAQLVNLQKVYKGLTKPAMIKLKNKMSFLLERWDTYTHFCSSHEKLLKILGITCKTNRSPRKTEGGLQTH